MPTASKVSTSAPLRTDGVLVLDYDARQKHRFLGALEGGGELAVRLPRGTVLADGDVLETDAGTHVLVRAAREALSVARAADPLLLARIAYHLGNRHVALQIEPGCVKYLHDHVLDDMARRLGAELDYEEAPFRPEGGAYGKGGHLMHRHAHGHDHHHPHAHGEHTHGEHAHGEHAHGEHAHGEHDHEHDHAEPRARAAAHRTRAR
ncbi:MAG TPA: urease accessory protein UreE [Polyangiaceae bacterium]|nr:urease accessory protein UreE [Polyangiaceae bacterium]